MLLSGHFQSLPGWKTSTDERGVSDPPAWFCDSEGPDFDEQLLVLPKISSLLWNNSNCASRVVLSDVAPCFREQQASYDCVDFSGSLPRHGAFIHIHNNQIANIHLSTESNPQ
jgi:hypothetical protein